MEAPEGGGRITPLPPPQPDGWSHANPQAPRPWLPALFALGGVIVFAVWLAGAGSLDNPEPSAGDANPGTVAPLSAPDDTTPPVTLRPEAAARQVTLGELLPWFDGSLILFGVSEGEDSLIVWESSLPEPRRYQLAGSDIQRAEPDPGTLGFVAYETAGRTTTALYLGGWETQEPIFVGSHGFAWDPAATGRIAWVGTDRVTGETALYSQILTGPTKKVAALPSGTRLIAWTKRGLVMAQDLGPAVIVVDSITGTATEKRPTLTVLRDDEGVVLASAVASPLHASSSGTIVVEGTAAAFEVSGIEIPTGATAVPDDIVMLDAPDGAARGFEVRMVPIRERLGDDESVFSQDGLWSLSSDAAWAGRTVNRNSVATLVVQSLESRSVRVIPLAGRDRFVTIGFSQNDEWFFASNPAENELLVINPLSGAQFSVPLPDDISFGGAYLRPAG